VPTVSGTNARLFGPDWFYRTPPLHPVVFSTPAMLRLVEEAGFRDARAWTRGDVGSTAGSLQIVLNRGTARRSSEGLVVRLKPLLAVGEWRGGCRARSAAATGWRWSPGSRRAAAPNPPNARRGLEQERRGAPRRALHPMRGNLAGGVHRGERVDAPRGARDLHLRGAVRRRAPEVDRAGRIEGGDDLPGAAQVHACPRAENRV
jgi:hypothetical protein